MTTDPLCLTDRSLEACRPGAVPAQEPVPEAAACDVVQCDEVRAARRAAPVGGQLTECTC
jgi:hypothetical protein